MIKLKRLISLIAMLAVTAASALGAAAAGTYAYKSADTSLFYESFENLEAWTPSPGISKVEKDGTVQLRLSGKTDTEITKTDKHDIAASLNITSDGNNGSNAYAGLAMCGENCRYELRVFKTSVRLYKINGAASLAASRDISGESHRVTLAVIDGIIRALDGDRVLFALCDDASFIPKSINIVSVGGTFSVSDFELKTESSFIYENFDNLQASSSMGKLSPEYTMSGPDGKWTVVSDGAKNVLTTDGVPKMSRVLYRLENCTQNRGVILKMKSGGWQTDSGDGGFNIYQRYTAGNCNYKLSFHNSRAEIIKVTPAAEEVLGTSERFNAKAGTYYEIAFEAIGNSDGSVALNGYRDGELIVSAADSENAYRNGACVFETLGEFKGYIDELNLVKISPEKPLYMLYANGRENKSVDIMLNGASFETEVSPVISGTEILVSANDAARILETDISFGEKSVTLSKNGISIYAENDSFMGKINGDDANMYAKPIAAGDTLMVPLSFFAEPFGAVISYVEKTRTAEITYDSSFLDGAEIYSKDGAILALNDNATLRMLKLNGVKTGFKGNNKTPMWTLYFLDDAARELNKTADLPSTTYYAQNWQLGNCFINSTDARTKSIGYDAEKSELKIEFEHSMANVTYTASFAGGGIDIDVCAVNKSEYPIQTVTTQDWTGYYSKNNTIITTSGPNALEFENVSLIEFRSEGGIFDGWLVTGDRYFASYYVHEGYKSENQPYMATDSMLTGPAVNRYEYTPKLNSVVWGDKGETVKSVKLSFRAYDTLRKFADDYNERTYGDMRPILDKAGEDVRDIYAQSYLCYLQGDTPNKMFNQLEKIAPYFPGHAMFHVSNSMHKNEGQETHFDAFPNYFPPNEQWGTTEDMASFIKTARDNGHMFMPRNSLYYYTEGSDIDKKYGGESLAVKRFDGMVQRVRWGLPGWIYSPSSNNANKELHGYFDTWKELGSTAFFTNVIAIVAPFGYRYDFHSDAERPDWFYDKLMEEFKWYGDRLPVFTEGVSGSRTPYQVGFMTGDQWSETGGVPSYQRDAHAGTYIGHRSDIFALFTSEFARLYPHNVSEGGQTAYRSLTHSLMYNFSLKIGVNLDVKRSEEKWKWLRAQALVGEKISSRLIGSKLNDEEENLGDGVKAVNYSGNKVTGNFGKTGYAAGDNIISPDGYMYKSADGAVESGIFDQYNGYKFSEPQMIINENTEGKNNIYAPLANGEFDICVPSAGIDNPVVTAHYPDGSQKQLNAVVSRDGIIFTYPDFDYENVKIDWGTGSWDMQDCRNIGYVEICERTDGGKTDVVSAVYVKGSLDVSEYNSLKTLPDTVNGEIRVENYTGMPVAGKIFVKGEYFGENVDLSYDINTSAKVTVIPVSFEKNKNSTDTGAVLNITQSGINPVAITDRLEIGHMQLPELNDYNTVNAVFPILVDWNTADASQLKNVDFEAVGAKNPYGTGYVLDNGDYLTFGGDGAVFKEKIYIEMIMKFTNLQNYMSDENIFVTLMNFSPSARMGRSMELRYSPAMDAFRFLMTCDTSFGDVTDVYNCVRANTWYHITASYDGENLVINVNGRETTVKYTGGMLSYNGPIKIGGNMIGEISYIRIGGK